MARNTKNAGMPMWLVIPCIVALNPSPPNKSEGLLQAVRQEDPAQGKSENEQTGAFAGVEKTDEGFHERIRKRLNVERPTTHPNRAPS